MGFPDIPRQGIPGGFTPGQPSPAEYPAYRGPDLAGAGQTQGEIFNGYPSVDVPAVSREAIVDWTTAASASLPSDESRVSATDSTGSTGSNSEAARPTDAAAGASPPAEGQARGTADRDPGAADEELLRYAGAVARDTILDPAARRGQNQPAEARTAVDHTDEVPAPRHPGGIVRVTDGSHGRWWREYYTETSVATVTVANGDQLALPYTTYREDVTRLDIPGYPLRENPQRGVRYNELPAAAQAAVREAAVADDQDRLWTVDTFPRYQRLAVRDGAEGEPGELWTVQLHDGARRRMTRSYPHNDPDSLVTELDEPVKSAEPVKDGYLVSLNTAELVAQATFFDAEPNLDGPGEQDKPANAFMITGASRIVFPGDYTPERRSDSELWLMTGRYSGTDWRFVITPVTYYDIRRHRPDADSNE